MMTIDDLIVHHSRAPAADALAGLSQAGVSSANDPETEEFLRALDEACDEAGIDFAFAASHCGNETNLFRDDLFKQRRNPAGLGVTGQPGVLGPVFPSYPAAARFYIAELLMKLRRPLGSFASARADAPDRFDRVQAVVNGSEGTFPAIRRIRDLNQRFGPPGADGRPRECAWMCESTGPESIVEKSRLLFPQLRSQNPTEDDMVQIDVNLTNRQNGKLTDEKAWITVHNNGNPNSNRLAERNFVDNGGGDQGVIFHGAVDADGIIQIMPLDRQGIHSGNGVGNTTSIGFEMCIGETPWEAVKENAAQFLAEIVTNKHGVLNYGSFSKANFSLDRVVEHRDWGRKVGVGSGLANPACPEKLIATDGGAEGIIARAKEIAGITDDDDDDQDDQPQPNVPGFVQADVNRGHPGNHDLNGTIAFGCLREWTVQNVTPRRQSADLNAPEVGAKLQPGEKFPGWYIFKANNLWWVLTKAGTRVLMDDLTESVRVTGD
jgi:hypothetical protein